MFCFQLFLLKEIQHSVFENFKRSGDIQERPGVGRYPEV